MHLSRLLSLSSTGTILIASQFPWFVNSPENPKPIEDLENYEVVFQDREFEPVTEDQKPLDPPREEIPDPEVNRLAPEDPIKRTRKVTKGEYLTKTFKYRMVLLTLSDDPNDSVYLSPLLAATSTRNFKLHFKAEKSKYSLVKKEEIKIRLFSKPGWKSSRKEDEYEIEVKQIEIMSLFDPKFEEYKVKQLLLSLAYKRSWSSYSDLQKKDIYYPGNAGWTGPDRIENLRNLEINHFKNFRELKEYVDQKLTSCVNENRSCVAHESELDSLDYNELSFYDGVYDSVRRN